MACRAFSARRKQRHRRPPDGGEPRSGSANRWSSTIAAAGGVLGTEIAAHADPEKAFVPIAMLDRAERVDGHAEAGRSVKELIALAKAQLSKLNYASAGVGTFQHLGSELFRIMSGTNIVHVPFKGGGRAMADVIAGNTEMCLGSLLQVIPHIDSKRLKLLGIGSVKHEGLSERPDDRRSRRARYDASNWWGSSHRPDTARHRDAPAKRGCGDTRDGRHPEEIRRTRRGNGHDHAGRIRKLIKTEMVKWAESSKRRASEPKACRRPVRDRAAARRKIACREYEKAHADQRQRPRDRSPC